MDKERFIYQYVIHHIDYPITEKQVIQLVNDAKEVWRFVYREYG